MLKTIKSDILDILFKFWYIFIPLFGLLLISVFGQFAVNGGIFGGLFVKHIIKISFAILLLFGISLCNRKIWITYSHALYLLILFLLICVAIFGVTKLGAKRWINLYVITIQPSEMMKLAIILSLAKYYSVFSQEELHGVKKHLPAICLIGIPMLLIMKQPDLGTAILLSLVGCSIVFAAGLPIKYIVYTAIAISASIPIIWKNLKTYQQNRVLTFLNPDRDPLGTGYHIMQSKIAVGSGGFCGKGFLNGTQSSLDFLPEKNTDFIFTALGEENGFIGACIIIILFIMLIIGLLIASIECKNMFGRYICIGVATLIFAHAFINISMVIGIVPVVGVPIPFISYGGSSLMTCIAAIGIAISCLKSKKNKVDFL